MTARRTGRPRAFSAQALKWRSMMVATSLAVSFFPAMANVSLVPISRFENMIGASPSSAFSLAAPSHEQLFTVVGIEPHDGRERLLTVRRGNHFDVAAGNIQVVEVGVVVGELRVAFDCNDAVGCSQVDADVHLILVHGFLP